MKMIKKAVSFFLCLSLMAALLLPVTAASITAGQPHPVTMPDDETPFIYEFIPGESGYYVYYSYHSQGSDPYGYIMDGNKELLGECDDTENGLDFSICCYMIAGQTYYLAATCYSGSAHYTVQIDALVSPTAIAFDRDTYTGEVRGYLYPQLNFYPVDCAHEEITMRSSNENVVRIGQNGDFCLGTPGIATVTATTQSGLSATCTVIVETPPAISLDTPWTLDASGGTQYLHFAAPADGWYGIHSEGDEINPWVEVLDTSLEEIVQDDSTLPNDNFFAPFYLKAGQLCYFEFNTTEGNTGTAQVILQRLSSATAVTFPYRQITAYEDTLCLLIPEYAPQISIPEELTWRSSNEDVVYVDQFGHTSFLSPGKAVITVTSETGKTATIEVTVLKAPTGSDLTAWGICGPNLQWQLNKSGVLTITGHGDMYHIYNNSTHWDRYSSQIDQVIFPDGITGIGYGAFMGCGFSELVIPSGVRRIHSNAFSNCTALQRVVLPQTLDYLGHCVFDYCISLKEVVLPEGLKRLPNATFRGCFSLSQITLPQSLTAIDDNAFSGCSLESVRLPPNLKTIGFGSFAGNPLSSIDLPSGLTQLRDYALINCRLKELTIPATVTALGCSFATGNKLHTIHFLGDAPDFDEYSFDSLVIDACYPESNRTWTEAVRKNYGGTVNWVPQRSPGITLSGSAPEGASIMLSQAESGVCPIEVNQGQYSISQLQPGSYTLTASAPKHVTRTYSFTVSDVDLMINIQLHLIGDVDGNGKVNIGDVAKINAHIKGTAELTNAYMLQCANVNGGKLNIGDSASLYAHIRGTKKLY